MADAIVKSGFNVASLAQLAGILVLAVSLAWWGRGLDAAIHTVGDRIDRLEEWQRAQQASRQAGMDETMRAARANMQFELDVMFQLRRIEERLSKLEQQRSQVWPPMPRPQQENG